MSPREPREAIPPEQNIERPPALASAAPLPCGCKEANAQTDLCSCLLRLHALLTKPEEPTLVRAELFTETQGTDEAIKSADSTIGVRVRTANYEMDLASVYNADGSKDVGVDYPAAKYNPKSYHIIPLVVNAPGATKAQCSRFSVQMWLNTESSDRWGIVVAKVTLFFSDGTNLFAEKTMFWLDHDNWRIDFDAS